MSNAERAIEDIHKHLQSAPTDWAARSQLGDALEECGFPEEAFTQRWMAANQRRPLQMYKSGRGYVYQLGRGHVYQWWDVISLSMDLGNYPGPEDLPSHVFKQLPRGLSGGSSIQKWYGSALKAEIALGAALRILRERGEL